METLTYDIIVIGGGHAGCEAAVAAARLGSRTLLLTMDMDKFAAMSCNPAVGGVAKGQIVREIDALGGQMGRITDLTSIQFRMLNRSKGAAMWSPRAQCDKHRFSEEWRRTLESTPNLYIWQDSAVEFLFDCNSVVGGGDKLDSSAGADSVRTSSQTDMSAPATSAESDVTTGATSNTISDRVSDVLSDATTDTTTGAISAKSNSTAVPMTEDHRLRISGVRTRMGVTFRCRAVVLTSGTFLDGMMYCGRSQAEGGRAGDAASHGLTECLRRCGFETGRMKTGTPARLDARTIHFDRLERQEGDSQPGKFSYSRETRALPLDEQMPCYIVYTTPEVHAILKEGFSDSPLFNGTIHGIGPRYCPSIEDKLRTFAGKDQHQLFLEPEGRGTNEYYLNGFSSSLPWEIQLRALHRIAGFEDLHIYRPGYAIEYDYFPPTQLYHSLETKLVSGLYFAGQVNGTTGYEEAAAQGLMAGINAHRGLCGEAPVVLRRDEAYIGVLIDDLVTKGVDEPYRMFTSRAEYRILLRQDNADLRLTPKGYEIGLITKDRYREFEQKKSAVESLVSYTHRQSVRTDEINDYLKSIGEEPLQQGRKLYDLIVRNRVTLLGLADAFPRLGQFIAEQGIDSEAIEEAEIQIKYKGYIEREKFIADKLHRLENIEIPQNFDFNQLQSLTIEARQKLSRILPSTIGQASRIPGVSPADISVLLVKFGR